jgi:hypothetical protein
MNIAQLVITAALALIGFYLAHSFTRQQRLRIAERRIDGYRKLWALMLVARPSRIEAPENNPLTQKEALSLLDEMTTWYFDDGNGMFLPHETQAMFVQAEIALMRYGRETYPTIPIRQAATPEDDARRVMRNLSLLRSQMKRDIKIYGVSARPKLQEGDAAFLRSANVNPRRWLRPWFWWPTRKERSSVVAHPGATETEAAS